MLPRHHTENSYDVMTQRMGTRHVYFKLLFLLIEMCVEKKKEQYKYMERLL